MMVKGMPLISNCWPDGRIIAAVSLSREGLGHIGAIDVAVFVDLVKEAAVRHQQVADVLVIRSDAQDQRVLYHARRRN